MKSFTKEIGSLSIEQMEERQEAASHKVHYAYDINNNGIPDQQEGIGVPIDGLPTLIIFD